MSITAAQHRLPNFLIIGASKCGTTSLWTYLNRHPDLFLADPKEPMFFNWEAHYDQGVDWYSNLFADAGNKQAIGEATTSYTYAPHSPDVPQRMHHLIPDCRLIYMVRPPVARTYSHYLQELQVRVWAPEGELGTFESAIKMCPMLIDAGMYLKQIEHFLRFYRRDQIKVLLLEDLKRDPTRLLNEVQEFLDLEPVDLRGDKTVAANIRGDHHVRNELNKRLSMLKSVPGIKLLSRAVPKSLRSKMYFSMTSSKAVRKIASLELDVAPPLAETNAELRTVFRQPNLSLGEFLGRDLSHWNET
jgi:hypothetical protein